MKVIRFLFLFLLFFVLLPLWLYFEGIVIFHLFYDGFPARSAAAISTFLQSLPFIPSDHTVSHYLFLPLILFSLTLLAYLTVGRFRGFFNWNGIALLVSGIFICSATGILFFVAPMVKADVFIANLARSVPKDITGSTENIFGEFSVLAAVVGGISIISGIGFLVTGGILRRRFRKRILAEEKAGSDNSVSASMTPPATTKQQKVPTEPVTVKPKTIPLEKLAVKPVPAAQPDVSGEKTGEKAVSVSMRKSVEKKTESRGKAVVLSPEKTKTVSAHSTAIQHRRKKRRTVPVAALLQKLPPFVLPAASSVSCGLLALIFSSGQDILLALWVAGIPLLFFFLKKPLAAFAKSLDAIKRIMPEFISVLAAILAPLATTLFFLLVSQNGSLSVFLTTVTGAPLGFAFLQKPAPAEHPGKKTEVAS
ncbi:MAG: hypothetical protein JW904_10605 [Spirochaetales bacterium]|nr:hypothetical protein [Spirochaetales bacterium]